jgi:hypothetical protein
MGGNDRLTVIRDMFLSLLEETGSKASDGENVFDDSMMACAIGQEKKRNGVFSINGCRMKA